MKHCEVEGHGPLLVVDSHSMAMLTLPMEKQVTAGRQLPTLAVVRLRVMSGYEWWDGLEPLLLISVFEATSIKFSAAHLV
jgi:hypothetical protein